MSVPLARRCGALLAVTLLAGDAVATTLPATGPSPRARGGLDPFSTSAIGSAPLEMAILATDASPVSTAALEAALDAFYAGDVRAAVAARDRLTKGSLDWKIATWAMALSGGERLPASVFADSLGRLGDWPGQSTILDAREKAVLARSGPRALLPLGAHRTLEGKLAVARELAASDPVTAAATLAPVWRTEALDAAAEASILRWGERLLTPADHRARMAMLLYRERVRGAERVAPRAGPGARELTRAVGAVAREEPASPALDAVPARYRSDPLYLYARARALRRGDDVVGAGRLLAASPMRDPGPDGGEWWDERRLIARQLLDRGQASLAYVVAAGNVGGSAGDRIDAHFTAGWIALRHLDDATTARAHFAAILDIGRRSLSVSRGAYWLGRAEERLGHERMARAAFERAAALPVTFYGQLAAERLGRTPLRAAYPRPTEADRRAFASSEFVRAIERLEGTDHAWRARVLYRHLARRVPTEGQAALLTARAERRGQDRLSLQMGKAALARGLDAAALAFPIGAIPNDAPLSATGRALAYAIARQESGFDREAESGAGALGLLQLMPATAREVAGWMNLPYSRARLTDDPAYNAALGARFLSRLLDRFDQSYVLAIAAYNAGPTRAIRWREAYGDPVGATPDEIVDWIERIPFSETRNYVQRVMENYQVYRARLDGREIAIGRDLSVGRR